MRPDGESGIKPSNVVRRDVQASRARSVVLFVDNDSQVFGALPFGRAFRGAGWRVLALVDGVDAMPAVAMNMLSAEFAVEPCPFEDLLTGEHALSADALGIFSHGARIYAARRALEQVCRDRPGERPALFTANNGLVFEKFEEGAFWRIGYDFICLNGPRDLSAMRDFLGSRDEGGRHLTVTGLRRLESAPVLISGRASGDVADRVQKKFVFAEQVMVPANENDRASLLQELARLARANPQWLVQLKARIRPGERTFHTVKGETISTTFAKLTDRPENFVLTHEPMMELLSRANLFATISSTAIFEALELGVPSVALANFGVRNHHGSHLFVASGLFVDSRSYDDLGDLLAFRPDAQWMRWVGMTDASKRDLVTAIEKETFNASSFIPQWEYVGSTPIPSLRSRGASAMSCGPLRQASSPFRRLARRLRAALERRSPLASVRQAIGVLRRPVER